MENRHCEKYFTKKSQRDPCRYEIINPLIQICYQNMKDSYKVDKRYFQGLLC
jgi:hypothetical protein